MKTETVMPPVSDKQLPAKAQLGGGDSPAPGSNAAKGQIGQPAAATQLSHGPEVAPVPPSQPNQVHVQVETPFVFNAKNKPAANVPPTPIEAATNLPVENSPARQVHLDPVIQAPPPEAKPKPEHRGFFGRVKGFFSAIFR